MPHHAHTTSNRTPRQSDPGSQNKAPHPNLSIEIHHITVLVAVVEKRRTAGGEKVLANIRVRNVDTEPVIRTATAPVDREPALERAIDELVRGAQVAGIEIPSPPRQPRSPVLAHVQLSGRGPAYHVQTLTLLRQEAATPALVTLTTGSEPPWAWH